MLVAKNKSISLLWVLNSNMAAMSRSWKPRIACQQAIRFEWRAKRAAKRRARQRQSPTPRSRVFILVPPARDVSAIAGLSNNGGCTWKDISPQLRYRYLKYICSKRFVFLLKIDLSITARQFETHVIREWGRELEPTDFFSLTVQQLTLLVQPITGHHLVKYQLHTIKRLLLHPLLPPQR